MMIRNVLKDSLITLVPYKGNIFDKKMFDEDAKAQVLRTKDK